MAVAAKGVWARRLNGPVNGAGFWVLCLGLGLAIAPPAAGVELSTEVAFTTDLAQLQLAQATGTEAERELAQLLVRGRAAYQAEDFAQAQRLWRWAVTVAQERGPLEGEGLALSLVALASVKLGRLDEAAIALERGTAIAQQVPEYKQQGLEVRLTMAQGQLALARGDGQRAVSKFQAAEKIYRDLGDRVGAVGAALNSAEALRSLGLYQRGLRVLLKQRSQLSDLAERSPKVAAQGWLSLGNSFRQLGQFEEALTALGRSLEISRGLSEGLEGSGGAIDGGPIEAIEVSLGLTHLAMARRGQAAGDGAAARQGKRGALQFLRFGTERSPELKVRSRLALVEAELFPRRRLSGVEQEGAFQGWLALRSTLEAMPPTRRSIGVGLEWVRHGWETYDWGVNPETVQTALVGELKRLAAAAEQLGDLRSQSQVLGTLGEIYGRAGRAVEAQALWRQSLQLANSANAPEAAYRWHWLLGKSLAKSGD
ncbi:MAG: tetratricopeptide repeat protein, partial [Cyanobacteria bacterium P01_H01_bin.130]